ncbi:isoaspartyl peptidase/L-asparaginase family protein [Vibrio mangrovi]|uniref:Isoaspartyl peptidase n=1 Tax=Vibrio mangrovi TaxID=474394 RepID=A0A1Y6IX77_9VIBR|nr:isoaspartyl peptidase/L-asparaginase [Vibrio mangrovi]MDW6002777.1 isoaspartyl peptidase/L-asparaginase [Vibrio mangrovi]SMS02269.1 Isoaspartyl peptidase precursor [Vibrio mangrovi]
MNKPFAIAIHGGAGTILRSQMTCDIRREIESALDMAVSQGHELLRQGKSAVDAVVCAVRILEDSPHFNAGKGSVLTDKEMVEMDAAVMSGKQRQAGAVAGIRHIRNPVLLARDVMQKSEHVLLIGEGAEEFASNLGYDYTEQDYFFTDRRYEQLLAMKEQGKVALSESHYPDDHKFGTVGAVALDAEGNLAAATSTGGVTNKHYGRVGDSPIIGAGTYAENHRVAVSATGMGEVFIRCCVASDVAARMRYLQEDIHTACTSVIQGDVKMLGGEGGLIAIDQNGEIHFGINCSGMYRGCIDIHGKKQIKIYADE